MQQLSGDSFSRDKRGKALAARDYNLQREIVSSSKTISDEAISDEAVSTMGEFYRPTSYTILVVDDSDTDRIAYQRYINAYVKTSGTTTCITLEAESGEEGLEICQTHTPDLILLDYMLPDLDGLEFLSALKSTLPELPPVIMLTGQGNERVAVEAMKIGVRDYLVKGDLSAESFAQAVQRVLSQQALEQLVSRQQRQQKLMASVALQVSKSTGLESTLQAAAEGMRKLLDCDRTAVYRFETDLSGTILAESVLPNWTVCMGAQIEDTCFRSGDGLDKYLDGHKTVISDIYQSKLTPCHIKMLERFEIKSNLVVPIVLNQTETRKKQVWGLLLAHQCRDTRTWREDELTLLDDLAVQLAIAIQQNEFIAALESRAQALTTANKRISATARLLKERNRELDEFAYIASHDLRAPLRAVSNLAAWIEEDIADQIPDENKQQLRLIRTRAQRLDNFINGLLDYSRAGRESLEPELVPLHLLIEEVVTSLAPPEAFRVTWPSKLPTIKTYKLLLQQVLSNLISNAIKYHDKESGTVNLSIQQQADKLLFSITDDGPGIDPTYHQQIFGIFKTLNSRDDVESTGIGLSIVKKIVERQQGELSVESALGKGSTFSFTWVPQD
ncbi:MAG: ATP-binding protein [Cyanobacteria bacterium J06650_10]